MKIKKILPLLSLLFIIQFYISCSEDELKGECGGIDNQEMAKVISRLENSGGYSGFANALKNLDASSLQSGEFTVFAVRDTPLKLTSGFSQEVLKRHIVQGKYSPEQLKQFSSLIALNGSVLLISVDEEGNIHINGVQLGDAIQSGGGIIFPVEAVIPVTGKVNKIMFTVYACNINWSIENPAQGIPQPGALIKIFDENKKLYITLKADSKGNAEFPAANGKIYYYLASFEQSSSLYEGFAVSGIITSQEEFDAFPEYRTSIVKKIGGLKLEDINWDARIDNQDKSDYHYLNSDSRSVNVYLVPESYNPIT